jgi:hypothetical protein
VSNLTKENNAPRRAVSPRAQLVVWGGLIGLLVLVGFGLKRLAAGNRATRSQGPGF